MMKFFRGIRRNLLVESETGKYFKYAIGEVLLVVVGILIALQIDNGNELRKARGEESIILSGLKEDFVATRLNFIETIWKQERTILRSRDLIDAIEAQDYSIQPDAIRENIRWGAFSHNRVEAVMGSYDAIVGSGKASIIKNKELLKALASFSSRYKAGFEDEAKSDHLLSLMMADSEDFFSALSDNGVRRSLSLKKQYTLEEQGRAVKNLYESEPFLAYFLQKTRWETIRVIHQKRLLKSLNNVLYQFDFNEVTPEIELCSSYVGTYTGVEDESGEIEISYDDGSLYVTSARGSVWELVQFNNSLFYIIDYNVMFDFSVGGDSSIRLSRQFLDESPVEFEKVID